MIKEALVYLGSLVAAQSVPQPLRLGDKEKATPIVALPDSVRLVSVEGYDAQPAAFRGAFETHSIDAFVNYLELHFDEGQRHPAIFIDPDQMKAVAYLDLGTHADPGWAEHTVGLRLRQAPDFEALVKRATSDGNRNAMTQMEFIDFMADWEDRLSFWDEDGMVEPRIVRRAISALKVSRDQSTTSAVGNLGAARTEMEQVNLTAAGTGHSIPERFEWTGKPFEELQTVCLRCPIREAISDPGARDQKPRLLYRIDGLAQARIDLANAFVMKLQGRLNGPRFKTVQDAIHVGSFKTFNDRGGRYDR